jgi:hypothetical protein
MNKFLSKSNFDGGKVNTVKYSFENKESKKSFTDALKINDLNMPSISHKRTPSELHGTKTQDTTSELPRRSSDKQFTLFNPKTVIGHQLDFRRPSDKSGNFKSLLENTTVEESLSTTEKKIAMAEILDKKDPNRNFLKRLSDKVTTEIPMGKIIERGQRKSNLTVITRVRIIILLNYPHTRVS